MRAADKVVNFADPHERSRIVAWAQKERRRIRIRVCEYRPRRSDRQNRYMWPCFIEPYAAMLSEHAGERITPDEAHEDLKRRFLGKAIVDSKTGVLLGEVVGSSASLTTAEFNEYLDKCAGFLAGIGIEVPEPDTYYERENAKETASA